MEDTTMKFWSTIDREETQFLVDMSDRPLNGKLECIIMTGPRKGETRLFPWLNLNTLWEQQNEEV